MEMTLAMLITSTLMFSVMTHPMSMGLMLLIQAMSMSLMTGMINMNFWYSYILFLIMVGGMLVLFIYMTSIASNEKFKFSLMNSMLMMISIIMIMTIFFTNKYIMNINEIINNQTMSITTWNKSITKYFSWPHSNLTIIMMMYLFIALLAVVSITKKEMGSIKMV